MKLFIALTFVLLRVLINTTATPCGGDPSPPVIILPNVGIGLGLGSSQSSSFAGSQSASFANNLGYGLGLGSSQSSSSAGSQSASFANNLGYGLGLGTSYGGSSAISQSAAQASSAAQALSGAQGLGNSETVTVLGPGVVITTSSGNSNSGANSASSSISNNSGNINSYSYSSGGGKATGYSYQSGSGGANSVSSSSSQAASAAQAAAAAQAVSAAQAASAAQAISAANSISSAQSTSLAISSAISQLLGIEVGGIGGIFSSLLGNLNIILPPVLSSTQLTTLISSLIGTVNLNLQVLMNIIFEANGIGIVLGKLLVLLSDLLQPLKGGIVSCGPLIGGPIIGQIGSVLQLLFGSVGGTEIILNQDIVVQLRDILTGKNGIQVQVNSALSNLQLFISETSSTLIILLQTLLGTLGSRGGLQILINILLNGILGAIIQLIGLISNTTICKILSSILKLLLVLANAFSAIFIKLNNIVSTCGCGCSKNLILALLILLRQLIAKVSVLAAALGGFSGGFNIVPATLY